MKSEFDKNLKQQLSDASLQEAGLSFDKDKLWNKIEQKKNKKRLAFQPWMSHAAAIAAGLAIGFFLYNQHDTGPATMSPSIANKHEIPAKAVVHDTVYVKIDEAEKHNQTLAQHRDNIIKQQDKSQPKQQFAIQITQQTPKESAAQRIQAEAGKPPEQKPESTFAIASKPLKILHLSDMDNENAPAANTVQNKSATFVVFSKNLPSEPNSETLSMLVVRGFNNSKK